MINSLAKSTVNQYNSTYKLWWKFCHRKQLEPIQGQVCDAIEFLQELMENNQYGYSTLNSHRSALSLLLSKNIGEDPRMKRFMKGVSKLKPPVPRYSVTWDPSQVLQYLKTIDTSNLKNISLKLLTLLALATGQRLQTLSLIKLENIVESPDAYHIFISDRIKTSSVGKNQPYLKIPYFEEDIDLCVASTLKLYLRQTETLRSSKNGSLFLTYKKPFAVASKQTLSRWIKETLNLSGVNVDIFKPHSVRHASTSLAKRKGLNIDYIQKTIGWSNKSKVFSQFYDRPLQPTEDYVQTILSSGS